MVTAAASGAATADDDDDDNGDDDGELQPMQEHFKAIDGVVYDPTRPTTGGMLFGNIGEFTDLLGSSPAADPYVIHNQLIRGGEWWSNLTATSFDNRMTDAQMVANIHARVEIADAWEDGDNSSDAYSRVLESMPEYWDVPAINHIETARAVLMEVAYASEISHELEDYDNFVTSRHPNPDDYTGDEDPVDPNSRPDTDLHETSIELPSGEEYEFEIPAIPVEWEDGDKIEFVFGQEMMDKYEPDDDATFGEGFFHDLETEDGNTVEKWDPGVSGGSQPDFDTETPFRFSELADQLLEIEEAEEDSRADYDQQIVDDIYEALDDGLIEPSDVRGVEGTAEWLSGRTDATDSRYMMALYGTLGLERADLTNVSHMTGHIDGYSFADLERDDSGNILSSRYEELEQSFEGQVFAELIGDTDLQSGHTYINNPLLWFGYDGEVEGACALNAQSLEIELRLDLGSEANYVYPHHDGKRLFVAHDNGDVLGYYLNDLDEPYLEWDSSNFDWHRCDWIDAHDGKLIMHGSGNNDSSYIYDLEDEIEVASINDAGDDYFFLDREMDWFIHAGGNLTIYDLEGDELYDVDLTDKDSDGISSNYATTFDNGNQLLLSDTGSEIQTWDISDDDPDNWEVNWTASTNSNVALVGPDYERVYVAAGNIDDDNWVSAYDMEDGSELYRNETVNGRLRWMVWNPDQTELFTATNDDYIYAIDPDDGEILREVYEPEINEWWLSSLPAEYDGVLNRTIAFDASEGEEHQVTYGTLEVDTMVDSDGDNVVPWERDDLEDELDELSDDDLETIFDEIDDLESVDDIENTTHLVLVLEEIGDGDHEHPEDLDSYDEGETVDWDEPKYDTTDVDEYVEHLEEVVEEHKDALNDGDGDDDETTIDIDLGLGDWMPDAGDFNRFIGMAVVAVVGAIMVGVAALRTLHPLAGR